MRTRRGVLRAAAMLLGVAAAVGGLTAAAAPQETAPPQAPELDATGGAEGTRGAEYPGTGERTILDRQHSDAFSVRLEGGELVLKTRADLATGAAQVLDPEQVLFHVSDAQRDSVPNSKDYAFLGAPGTGIWKISQAYTPDWLWAGWEAESIAPAVLRGGHIELRLTEFSGPADVELYVNGDEGPERVLSSSQPGLDTIHTSAGAHTHANWVFTAPGEYALTMVASATASSGQSLVSQPQQYHFLVGGPRADTSTPPPGDNDDSTTAPPPDHKTPQRGTAPPSADPPPASDAPKAPTAKAAEECVAVPETTEISPENVDVVADGHFDFGPLIEGGKMLPRVKDDRVSPAAWVDPGGLVFHLNDAAKVAAPGGQFGFLGSGAVWQIPLTQKSGVPWLGWNTQHPTVAGKSSGNMTLTLEGLEGPGDVFVYSVNSWGQLEHQYFGTAGGFPRSTSIEVGASGVHVHGVWAFTQPGAYYATMAWNGTVDGAAQQGTAILTFFVGDGDARAAAKPQTVTTFVGRTASGEACDPSLAATGFAEEDLPELVALGSLVGLAGLAILGAAALRPRTPNINTPARS